MQCDEVVRELAAPTADRDPAEMADHLAGCPACAEWARRAETLDRLWDATRPVEPSAAAWDAVWANIAQTLPCSDPIPARSEDAPAVGVAPSRNGHGPRLLVHPGSVTIPASNPAVAVAGRRSRGRGWRLASIALIGLAQAAAILIALGLAWQPQPPVGHPPAGPDVVRNDPEVIRSASPVGINADFEASCTMVIRFDQKSSRIEDRTLPEMNVSADFGMEVINAMESVTSPPVAAR